MSRIKADLSRLSLNQLCTLTGKTSRTLKKMIASIEPEEESGTLFYRPPEVLPLIYGVSFSDVRDLEESDDDSEDKRLDPIREKALLDRARRLKVELEIEEEKKQLIRISKVESDWSKMAGAFRSKILNLPKKCAPRVCATKDMREIEKILTSECHEALTELSKYGAEFGREKSHSPSR